MSWGAVTTYNQGFKCDGVERPTRLTDQHSNQYEREKSEMRLNYKFVIY